MDDFAKQAKLKQHYLIKQFYKAFQEEQDSNADYTMKTLDQMFDIWVKQIEENYAIRENYIKYFNIVNNLIGQLRQLELRRRTQALEK
jgi:hypothetical protein